MEGVRTKDLYQVQETLKKLCEFSTVCADGAVLKMFAILSKYPTLLGSFFMFMGKKVQNNALSFYMSQNVLCQSKFFVTDQKFIYILWQSQTFCARQKDDLKSVKLVFVPAQKFLKKH